jgi:hypothetical protein
MRQVQWSTVLLPSPLSYFEFVTVLIRFVQASRVGACNTQVMSAGRMIWNVTIVMGILLAAELGFLLFLGENLIAIFLGIPQIIVIGGILWLTHDLLAERRS